jgi:hypothetical protein
MHKIPLWIYGLSGLVLAILAFQVFAAVHNPALWYKGFDASITANSKVLITLAGRNVVMFAITALAMRSRNAMLLGLTFVMHTIRESWDMLMVPVFDGVNGAAIGQAMSFLFFLLPYAFALRTLRRIAQQADTA